MKFKLDENMPHELAGDLSAGGHQAETVPQQGMTGASDRTLMEHVQREGAVFLTMDKGIADVRQYPPSAYAGIVLFRPHSTGRHAVVGFVRRHLHSLLQEELPGHLLVVSDAGIRFR